MGAPSVNVTRKRPGAADFAADLSDGRDLSPGPAQQDSKVPAKTKRLSLPEGMPCGHMAGRGVMPFS
ncbi:hypothetical protein RALTA_A0518 [Cupriavidus taiwanensis LMG 19424]|uniref:Uncharacterized protein n=1 Tax=Cupriavidus taiwanensis (strain DSM 17343 / BCRC 17206 / CCUG 44338 / CIP 107171 / LMG 19424 / R1) TaxID=977880 RepID=B2AHD6_CUPTR|nr:hypothetical protein RALTA_A0518 [Cupriavidus taiwanensis LMG 19424]